MIGVYLRDHQGNVWIHAVIRGIGDYGMAGAGKLLFNLSRDFGIKRGKKQQGSLTRLAFLYLHVPDGRGHRIA